MPVSYIPESTLNTDLSGLDSAVRTDVLNALNLGAYQVQTGSYSSTDPTATVLDVTGGSNVVSTDDALKAIVFDSTAPGQYYVTGGSSVYVALGSGADSINLYDNGNDTVQGGNGGDVLGGGAGADLILGGTGNDQLYGGPGPNTLIGGGGNDFIRVAGAHSEGEAGTHGGNSTIVDLGGYIGAGTSTLTGGTGNDTLWGYGGDTLIGGTGNSVLHGGTNSLVESGSTAGGSNILGSGSTDANNANTLQGGAGADSLYGGGGADTLIAGSGNNTLSSGTGEHQSLMGGSGNDLLQDIYSGGTDTLTAGAGSGTQTLVGQQGDTFSSAGSTGNNVFWVEGGAGAGSSITGGSGNDTFHIETHTGNDTITGGGGTDVVGFGGRASTDIAPNGLTGSAGNYSLTFNNGQVIALHGITELYFTDGVVKLT
jgi:Ca2+-binding RTX toxin-like protein